MLNEVMFLQAFGFQGGTLGNILTQLEQVGFFSIALPFLLIFALIFGVLARIKIFGDQQNKTINGIIALVVSLMAIQFGFVSAFFSDIFPRLGVWLSVILIFLIIIGLLNPSGKWMTGLMVILGLIIVMVILSQTFGDLWFYPNIWIDTQNMTEIIVIGLIIGGIIWVWATMKPAATEVPQWMAAPFKTHQYGQN